MKSSNLGNLLTPAIVDLPYVVNFTFEKSPSNSIYPAFFKAFRIWCINPDGDFKILATILVACTYLTLFICFNNTNIFKLIFRSVFIVDNLIPLLHLKSHFSNNSSSLFNSSSLSNKDQLVLGNNGSQFLLVLLFQNNAIVLLGVSKYEETKAFKLYFSSLIFNFFVNSL